MESKKLISEAEELPRTVVRRMAKEKLSNDVNTCLQTINADDVLLNDLEEIEF